MPARWLVLVTFALVAVPTAGAQAVCLRARPLPACRAWWVFEPAIGSISNQNGDSSSEPRASDAFYLFEVGAMGNFAARHAAGGSVVFGSLGYGVRGRYRYWSNPDVAFDLAPTLLWEEHEGLTRVDLQGSAMVLGWMGGFVGVSRHLERERWEWSFGIKAGGAPGLGLTVAGILYGLAMARGLSRL